MTTNYLADQDTLLSIRTKAADAALTVANCMTAVERAKSLKPADRREAKADLALAMDDLAFITAALARAYDDALITVRNHVHGVDVKIPRWMSTTRCEGLSEGSGSSDPVPSAGFKL